MHLEEPSGPAEASEAESAKAKAPSGAPVRSRMESPRCRTAVRRTGCGSMSSGAGDSAENSCQRKAPPSKEKRAGTERQGGSEHFYQSVPEPGV